MKRSHEAVSQNCHSVYNSAPVRENAQPLKPHIVGVEYPRSKQLSVDASSGHCGHPVSRRACNARSGDHQMLAERSFNVQTEYGAAGGAPGQSGQAHVPTTMPCKGSEQSTFTGFVSASQLPWSEGQPLMPTGQASAQLSQRKPSATWHGPSDSLPSSLHVATGTMSQPSMPARQEPQCNQYTSGSQLDRTLRNRSFANPQRQQLQLPALQHQRQQYPLQPRLQPPQHPHVGQTYETSSSVAAMPLAPAQGPGLACRMNPVTAPTAPRTAGTATGPAAPPAPTQPHPLASRFQVLPQTASNQAMAPSATDAVAQSHCHVQDPSGTQQQQGHLRQDTVQRPTAQQPVRQQQQQVVESEQQRCVPGHLGPGQVPSVPALRTSHDGLAQSGCAAVAAAAAEPQVSVRGPLGRASSGDVAGGELHGAAAAACQQVMQAAGGSDGVELAPPPVGPGPEAQGAVAAPIGVMPPIEKLKRPLRLKLSEWIPHAGVTAAFEAKGVTKLYPWQAAALECGEDGNNLVYCAPTSGGKSLVAEILMIRRLVAALARQAQEQQLLARAGQRGQQPRPATPRALLVLPYVSIVSEKAEHLTQVLAPLRGRVRGYAGAEQISTPLSAPDEMVAVMTMEKANSTVNRMIADGRLGELCCVVVDEAHMVGDPHRGICLELCLTKLRFQAAAAAAAAAAAKASPACAPMVAKKPHGAVTTAAAAAGASPLRPLSCQLVCMSATMSGLDDMCGWLGARLFMTNFRPVPLTEHVVFRGKVFRKLTKQEMDQRAAVIALQGEPQKPTKGEETEAADSSSGAPAKGGAATRPSGAGGNGAKSTAPPAGGFSSAAAGGGNAGADGSAAGGGSGPIIEPLVEERDLPESSPKDPDRLVVLVAEVAREGHSTLVFCATRSACQGCAGLLAELLPKQLGPVSSKTYKARRALLAQLQDESGGYLSPELEKLVVAGVAYHHAGLTSQERSAVERGFRAGLIHTLTATSTLAAGINLPARRVILRSLWQGIGPVSRAQYLQMIGRAGRAGQSPIGEAFLIGKGNPHTLQGEWRDVCRLMTARLPPLRCCLLDTPPAANEEGGHPRNAATGSKTTSTAAAGAGKPPDNSSSGAGPAGVKQTGSGSDNSSAAGPAGAAAPAALGRTSSGPLKAAAATAAKTGDTSVGGETHLQRMLLEAIANGSVTTGTTVEAFIRSTLLYQQAGYGVISDATFAALSALRQRRLVAFSAPAQQAAAQGKAGLGAAPAAPARAPLAANRAAGAVAATGAGAVWQPTQMGRAIYDSCLPTAAGQSLYDKLVRAADGLTLQGGLHLLCLLMSDASLVEIDNWEAWAAMLERMPREPHLRVAEALGVKASYAQRLAAGRRGSPEESARHCRFASACLMHDVLCEGDLHELEQMWGTPGGLTKNGISRGQLQKQQGDVSKLAGMAAVMAGSCGWWALQALLDGLSQQAAAGVRPELLPLMALPGMTGARARGLHAAGITKPSLLAVADEEDVKKALAASLPRTLRQQKPVKGSKESAVAAAASASIGNAIVARGARALIETARQYMSDLAARVAAEEAEGDEDAANRLAEELRAAQPSSAAQGAAGTGILPAGALPSGAAGAGAASLRGSARIREISDASSAESLEAFLQAWRAQPSFAVAVISSRPVELEHEQHLMQQQQLGIVSAAGTASTANAASRENRADGSRPSAVNTALTIPGPPIAAVREQHPQRTRQGESASSSGKKRLLGSGQPGIEVCGGGARASSGAREVEGLVVAWNPIEAFVLTFHHGGRPCPGDEGTESAAGCKKDSKDGQDSMTGGPAGTKRKPEEGLPRAQKLRGTARVGADRDGDLPSAPADPAKVNGGEPGRGASSGSALWRAACEVLGSSSSVKVCWHTEAQLAALLAAGCDAAGQWDDPRVMAWMAQGTAGPQELLSLQELQRTILPSYAVRIPLQHRGSVTAACRIALGAWALAAALRALLAAEGVAAQYRLVEAPLTLELARTRLHLTSPHMWHAPPASTLTSHTASAAAAAPAINTSSCSSSHDAIHGGLVLDEAHCREELSRAVATQAACHRLISEICGKPSLDLSQPAIRAVLCNREYLYRRAAPPPPELRVLCPMGRRSPGVDVFAVKPCALGPRERARADALARLLTRHAAAAEVVAALQALLAASSATAAVAASAANRAPGSDSKVGHAAMREKGSVEKNCAAAPQAGAVEGGLSCDCGDVVITAALEGAAACGAARFALQRVGTEGRLVCVFSGETGGPGGGCSSAGAPVASEADGLVVVTELSSAPVPAPSLQQQYCSSPQGEQLLQSRLPLPVLFLDVADAATEAGEHPPQQHQHPPPDPRRLRPGLLLEIQGPNPCVALQFGPDEPSNRDMDRWALVASTDSLTRQPVRLLLPASRLWCSASCCGPDQAVAAAQAGQLGGMAMPQVLRCPAEEVLRPPCGWAFVTVLYPYLHLAVLAHCSGDGRLVEALYQPQPWTAVAAAWEESQSDQLRRLQLLQYSAGSGTSLPLGGPGLCSPPPLEMAARQVVSLALLQGCSQKDLATALALGGDGKVAAAALVSSFLEAFPGVGAHREELLAKAKKEGHVTLPSGRHLRPATRQLTAGGVAAGPKLQRLLSRMQLGGAATEVVRTAASLALQRADQRLAELASTADPGEQQEHQGAQGMEQDPQRLPASDSAPGNGCQVVRRGGASEATGAAASDCGLQQHGHHGRQQPQPSPRVSLVWVSEAQVTLCVPRRWLPQLLQAVNEAASGGVMGQLGLRVPLHVSVYTGQRLGLLHCEQYVPGGEDGDE